MDKVKLMETGPVFDRIWIIIDRTTNKYISLSNDEEAHLTYLRQEFANNNLKVNNAIDAEHVRLYLQDNSKSNIKKRSVLLNLH